MSRTLTVPARVAIECSETNLFAHVELDVAMEAGDSYRLGGPPIRVGFGEQATLVRTATIRRASPLRRAWTRFAGHFGLTHLYEVSFSNGSFR